MTAREAIMQGNEGMEFRDVIDNLYDDVILMCMRDYAELKCKELLEIVAEKAEVRLGISFCNYVVDKDSILNAVDLKEFIK
jgi:hypothetical protein